MHFDDVHEQDLAIRPRGECDRTFRGYAGPIAGGQHGILERELSLYDMKPHASFVEELVNHMLPRPQHRRVHHRILVDVERALPTVG